MPNTSATGGYLQPAVSPAPLEGQDLNRFLQQYIANLSGLDGTLVRPRYQAAPPNIPDAGEAWAAIGVTTRNSDSFPFIGHDPSGNGTDYLQRQEELVLLCSFYDLGTNGLADKYASLVRDNSVIAQNREVLAASGFALAYTGEMIAVPSLFSVRWLYRVDIPITLRRQIDRTYPVLNVLSAEGTIETDDITLTFNA